jgi:hypothetical protein
MTLTNKHSAGREIKGGVANHAVISITAFASHAVQHSLRKISNVNLIKQKR